MTKQVSPSGTAQGEVIPAILLVAMQLASIGTAVVHRDIPMPPPVATTIDSLYFAGNPEAALALACESTPGLSDSADLEWRAARSLVAIGMTRHDEKQKRDLYTDALNHARRAWTLSPNDLNAHYWVAVAAGRRTTRSEPLYSAKLAREVYEHTTAILAVDSLHAGAHHALGMLHAELLRVPSVLRTLGGRALTGNLPRPSAAGAEAHLRRAVELEPLMMTYLVDLARFYVRTGRRAEVDELARRIASLPARHPMDETLRAAFASEWQHEVSMR